MATRTSILGSSGTAERILGPWRLTRMVSAAPLTWDPSLFWPETAKASETRTRELLRPRSCGMSCAICLFADTLGFQETIEPSASDGYITGNPFPRQQKADPHCPKVTSEINTSQSYCLRGCCAPIMHFKPHEIPAKS